MLYSVGSKLQHREDVSKNGLVEVSEGDRDPDGLK